MFGIAEAEIRLDPDKYRQDQGAFSFAVCLARAVEAKRKSELKDKSVNPNTLNGLLFAGPDADPGDVWVARRPWYDYATDLELLSGVAKSCGIELSDAAETVFNKLRPPNWQVFFWMRLCLVSIPINKHMALLQNAQLQMQAHYEKVTKEKATARARVAANARHSKPGGTREKQSRIRAMWASGKYSTREICAEEEYAALGMSYSAARKALRNTPAPS